MSTIQEPETASEWESQPFGEGPFPVSETVEDTRPHAVGFLPWTEDFSPFAEANIPGGFPSEAESALDEAFAAVRDDLFDEAVADLVTETEDVIGERFADEAGSASGPERERIGNAHLAALQFEAERYLEALGQGISGLDVESLDETALSGLLDRYDPAAAPLSPAAEQFLGSLVRKAKGVAKFVVNTAKKAGQVAGKVAGKLAEAALQRLKKLIRPLLKRVLSFAIDRLPEPLRAPARLLATKITSETESENDNEDVATSPALATDTEALVESFDAALAEAMVADEDSLFELEALTGSDAEQEEPAESRELELLAEARGRLMDTLAEASDGENLTPAVEQFVPAVLMALRAGINLVGRPRVVGFLAKYLAQLIGRWVGPTVSGPLSKAVVDTGLRLVSLESEEPELERDAVPAMLAATIEDTVRRLAENEDYILEDEDLMQVATADAFERAVATNFPAAFVRQRVQRAPSIGGRFVARRPRSARPYRRYSRAPEVEITAAIAERVPTFGGVTLAATLRAAGVALPVKVRVHLFEATVGTSLRRIAAIERGRRGAGRMSSTQLHPLTPAVSALLLREPGLGVTVGDAFLRSRQRVAAGQRFYYLEPLTGGGASVPARSAAGTAAAQRSAPSQGWIVADTPQSRVIVALYFSETDAQRLASGVRDGRPAAVLLPALTAAYDTVARSIGSPGGRVRILKEAEGGDELFGSAAGRLMPVLVTALRKALRSWLLPLLADWVRARSAEFASAVAKPANGVTVTVTLNGVPGMGIVRDALHGKVDPAALQTIATGAAFRGSPTGTVAVKEGKNKP